MIAKLLPNIDFSSSFFESIEAQDIATAWEYSFMGLKNRFNERAERDFEIAQTADPRNGMSSNHVLQINSEPDNILFYQVQCEEGQRNQVFFSLINNPKAQNILISAYIHPVNLDTIVIESSNSIEDIAKSFPEKYRPKDDNLERIDFKVFAQDFGGFTNLSRIKFDPPQKAYARLGAHIHHEYVGAAVEVIDIDLEKRQAIIKAVPRFSYDGRAASNTAHQFFDPDVAGAAAKKHMILVNFNYEKYISGYRFRENLYSGGYYFANVPTRYLQTWSSKISKAEIESLNYNFAKNESATNSGEHEYGEANIPTPLQTLVACDNENPLKTNQKYRGLYKNDDEEFIAPIEKLEYDYSDYEFEKDIENNDRSEYSCNSESFEVNEEEEEKTKMYNSSKSELPKREITLKIFQGENTKPEVKSIETKSKIKKEIQKKSKSNTTSDIIIKESQPVESEEQPERQKRGGRARDRYKSVLMELMEIVDESEESKAKLKKLREENAKLEGEKNKLSSKLDALSSQLRQSQKSEAELQRQLMESKELSDAKPNQQLEQELRKYKIECRKLKKELEKLRVDKESAEKEVRELRLLRSRPLGNQNQKKVKIIPFDENDTK